MTDESFSYLGVKALKFFLVLTFDMTFTKILTFAFNTDLQLILQPQQGK